MSRPKLSEFKGGDVLIADGGFTCLRDGQRCTVHRNVVTRELYVRCADGQHALVGQVHGDGRLIGFTKARDPEQDAEFSRIAKAS